MTTKQRKSRLVRLAATTDATADQWRTRMEEWIDLVYPILAPLNVQCYTGDFGTFRFISHPDLGYSGGFYKQN